ncbi:PAS domain S-box-containing protein [Micromonospora pattaloongensis]|uniref:Sensor-like histidine kinase SenX3 n=1 Tax=Micromonospora pattaloongensis TaxID=405436 RepID=A0A1H3MVS2_9ACTN|nr:PAS domain S-box-containing protein [Micromonospora pattaloongensis]
MAGFWADYARLRTVLSIGAGIAVALIGLMALAEWRTVHAAQLPGMPTVVPLAPSVAVGLLLGGVALLLLATPRPGLARRSAGRVCGALTAAIGLLGLAQPVAHAATDAAAGWLLGPSATAHDQLGAAASVALLLNGAALVALHTEPRWRVLLTGALLTAAAGVALVAMLGYVFEQAYQPDAGALAAMPLLTSFTMLELSLGIMFARPEQGPLKAFFGGGPGNVVARRLAPALILLPFGTGMLSMAAVRAGLGPGAAITISTVLTILILVFIVAGTVRALNETDARRRQLLADLADERDFTRTLLQSLNEGVVVFDADRAVIEVNRRWCELSGRSRTELIGQRPPYPWEPEVASGSDELVVRPDGTTLPVLAASAEVPGEDGRPRAYVATYVDITDRKRAEDFLAAHASALEQVNDELRHANRRLERGTAFKSDLMAMVSHEISQPLSSMASLAELLAADWPELPDDTRFELAVKIDKNTRRLTTMVQDLTLLFQLEAGAVTARRAPVPVADVVESVVGALAAPTPPISVTVDPELYALGDRSHLYQIVRHLVSNALRHGEPPVEITARRHGETVALSVRDHGPGVPADAESRLFDRFGRGGGLGLFIARHLVEANGGTIRYEAAEPHGARLVLRLEPAAGTRPLG